MLILNDSEDSFHFRLAASSAMILSFIEGRQITQEDDMTVSTVAGFMSLSAIALSCLKIYRLSTQFKFKAINIKANGKIVLELIVLSGLLIRIAYLRAHFLNPSDYLDRHHPLVWNYLGTCASALTLGSQLDP